MKARKLNVVTATGYVACDICGKVCKNNAGLAAHKRIVHDGVHPRGPKPVPKKFPIQSWMREYCARWNHYPDLNELTESFLDWHRERGSKKRDWDAAWRTWFRNDIKFNGRKAWMDGKQMPEKKRFVCENCGKEFKNKAGLSGHLASSTVCGKNKPKRLRVYLEPRVGVDVQLYCVQNEILPKQFVRDAVNEKLLRANRKTFWQWVKSFFDRTNHF